MHEQPRPGHAILSLQEVGGPDHTRDDPLDVGIRKHDHRGFATEFKGHFFQVAARLLQYLTPNFGRPGERDFIDVIVRHQCRAGLGSVPGKDVDDTVRNTDLLGQVPEQQRRQRREFSRFQHDRAPGCECRGKLHHGHRQWRVPRRNRRHDANGFPARVSQGVSIRSFHRRHRDRLAVNLGTPAGVITQKIGTRLADTICGNTDGHAVVQHFQLGE